MNKENQIDFVHDLERVRTAVLSIGRLLAVKKINGEVLADYAERVVGILIDDKIDALQRATREARHQVRRSATSALQRRFSENGHG